METATTGVRHIYQLDAPERAPAAGSCSGEVTPRRTFRAPGAGGGSPDGWTGPVVRGGRVQVALVRRPRGTGSAVHTHPNEQFGFVLSGALLADIDGQVVRVPAGYVIHVPAGMPHSLVATAEGDAVYYAMNDTRAGFDAAPVDSADGESSYLTGFGTGPGEWRAGTADLPQARTVNASGRTLQYAYDIAHLDAVPAVPTSAQVIPRNFISGKSSSFGAALRGDRLQVGHIHKGVGSGTKLHTHPNEQFSFVLEGTMIYQIDNETIEAPPNSVTHLPPGIRHSAIASAAGDVLTFVAKDTSHGMSGPPVDGIEDGPVYLPGFDPRRK